MPPTISPSPSLLEDDTDLTPIFKFPASKLRDTIGETMEDLEIPRSTTRRRYLVGVVALIELELLKAGDEPNDDFVDLVGWWCQSRKPLLVQDLEDERIEVETPISKSELVKMLIEAELTKGTRVLATPESPTESLADSRTATPPPTVKKAKPAPPAKKTQNPPNLPRRTSLRITKKSSHLPAVKKTTTAQQATPPATTEEGTPVSTKSKKKKAASSDATEEETPRAKKA